MYIITSDLPTDGIRLRSVLPNRLTFMLLQVIAYLYITFHINLSSRYNVKEEETYQHTQHTHTIFRIYKSSPTL